MKIKNAELLFGFLGYAVGRMGHILFGSTISYHHWILGMIVIATSFLLRKKYKWYNLGIAFGIGLFVSDLNDFLNFRIYGEDIVEKYNFWGID